VEAITNQSLWIDAMHHPESGKQHFGISARRVTNRYHWDTCAIRDSRQRHQSWHWLDLSRNGFAEGFFPLLHDSALIFWRSSVGNRSLIDVAEKS
jgi:hypothetical protein